MSVTGIQKQNWLKGYHHYHYNYTNNKNWELPPCDRTLPGAKLSLADPQPRSGAWWYLKREKNFFSNGKMQALLLIFKLLWFSALWNKCLHWQSVAELVKWLITLENSLKLKQKTGLPGNTLPRQSFVAKAQLRSSAGTGNGQRHLRRNWETF